MVKEKTSEEQIYLCPAWKFFRSLEQRVFGKESRFKEHLALSRIELLKAIRSLVDEHIEDLEKKSSEKRGDRLTKIKVE